MKQKKYPNGYAEKIQFWANQLLNDKYDRKYILAKIEYFTQREIDRVEFLPQEKEQIVKEEPKVEWLFNFFGGGWNSVWATTKEEAYEKAVKEYEDSITLNPDPNTFRVSTESDYNNLMSLFY